MANTVKLKDAWDGVADCRSCGIRQSVLFAHLNESDFEKIHQPIDQYSLEAGQTLYRQGEPATHLVTVRNGLLKLVQYLPDGSQRIVRLVRNTELTGQEAMLGKDYEHDAIALEPTEVCMLPSDIVMELLVENLELRKEMMCRCHNVVVNADAWLTELSVGSARQRLARLMLSLNPNTPENIVLPGREDVGSILGITTETASRTVAEFKRSGIITELKKNHFLLDIPALENITRE